MIISRSVVHVHEPQYYKCLLHQKLLIVFLGRTHGCNNKIQNMIDISSCISVYSSMLQFWQTFSTYASSHSWTSWTEVSSGPDVVWTVGDKLWTLKLIVPIRSFRIVTSFCVFSLWYFVLQRHTTQGKIIPTTEQNLSTQSHQGVRTPWSHITSHIFEK